MNLSFIKKTGPSTADLFEDLAKLRITVFKEFPYLYKGSLDYEKEYLKIYSQSNRSIVFAVYDQEKMIGATTAIPLIDETEEVQRPFLKQEMPIETIFYFGESILLQPYRGLGLGHRFMDERIQHAMSFDQFKMATFCSVVRPDQHPERPIHYRSNDEFWKKRGFIQQSQLQTTFDWPDIGASNSTSKPMMYWTKILRP